MKARESVMKAHERAMKAGESVVRALSLCSIFKNETAMKAREIIAMKAHKTAIESHE